MKILKDFLRQLRQSQKGQGMVEYVLILTLVSVVVIGALSGIGNNLGDVFDKVIGVGDSNISNDEIDDLVNNRNFIPIANANELNNLRKYEEQTFGKGTKWEGQYTSGLDKKYIQVKDIDLYGIANFTPIGDNSTYDFKGVFDGGGYTINNLRMDRSSDRFAGLFGNSSNATFKNIGLVNVDIKGKENVGALVGWNGSSSEITNCYVTGKVTGNKSMGGLVGVQTDTSKIINSYSEVEVNGYIDGNMTGNGQSIGGLLGTQDSGSQVIKSYATGNVFGRNQVGGLVGRLGASTSVIDSYATGDVTHRSFMMNITAGGLAGHMNNANITNSYATGKVTSMNSDGSITTDRHTGGLLGEQINSTVTNSYYDRETTGQNDTGKGEGKSTDEMKVQSTYNGWDFDSVWKIISGEYPTLQ